MSRTRDIIKYDFDSYDKHACLKPSTLLILAMIFACREYLLPLVVLLGSIKGRSGYEIDFLLQEHHTLALLSELPALLVVYALIRRVPSAESAARWIWHRGRIFLGGAALLDIAMAVAFGEVSFAHMTDDGLLSLARIAVDACILGYLALSSRVKDTFAQFPIEDGAVAKKKTKAGKQ